MARVQAHYDKYSNQILTIGMRPNINHALKTAELQKIKNLVNRNVTLSQHYKLKLHGLANKYMRRNMQAARARRAAQTRNAARLAVNNARRRYAPRLPSPPRR